MMTEINACVTLEQGDRGVQTVWLDSPQRSVNVFDLQMIDGLEQAISQIAALPKTSLVVFRSRKIDCFFAGADVHAIAAMRNPQSVQAVIQRGQTLMQRLADLPLPTLAVIDGMCMGGGLEFAMACRYRVATDTSKTKLSLPEIRLGLIPGWGGTQRLPKLVGLQQALNMILKGSSVAAGKALRTGLVDRLLTSKHSESQLEQCIADILSGRFASSTGKTSWLVRLLTRNPLGRRVVLTMARRTVADQVRHYPALEQAIAAIGMAYQRGHDGFAFESEAFTKLLFTPTAQSLLGLFLQRDRAKKMDTWLSQAANPAMDEPRTGDASIVHGASKDAPRPVAIQHLAVVGAGQMGAGIGALAAQQGLQVTFKEINEPTAQLGAQRVAQLLDKQQSRGQLSACDSQLARRRCQFTTRWEDLAECDAAIEAVLEVDSVKRDVFQHLDRCLPAHSLLVSNTSSLSVTRMAMATKRREKVAGLHFFHPVGRMELVEVVRTELTDEPTLTKLLELVRRLGKTPIVTSDKPGFLVNRVLFPYLGEAVRMVAEGYDIATIDRELKRFGMPMGPLELIDQVGIDIATHVANSLASVQADAEVPVTFLADMAQRKWLGKKTGIGFYDWSQGRRPNPKLTSNITPTDTSGQFAEEFAEDGLTAISRRLVYPMLNEAVHCLDELVVTEPWMVDLGMVLGTGFAPMHGGPLRLIDAIGVPVVSRNMAALEQKYGQRFAPAHGLQTMAGRHQSFYQVGNSNPLNEESKHEPRYTPEA